MKHKITHLILATLFTAGTAHAATVTWDASGDTTWSAGSDATSWSGATYNAGDDVQFTDPAGGTVTLSGVINPNSMLVNSSGNYTFVGDTTSTNVISGGGTLTKSGTGELHFDGRNHIFGGGITINEGRLSFNNSPRSAIANSSLTMNGGEVYVQTENFTVYGLSGTSGTIETFRRRFTVNQSTDTTFGGSIAGSTVLGNATSFGKSGTGTLTLTGTNTYLGNTIINGGGTLEIGGSGTLGSGSYANAITFADSSTLNYNSTANQTLSGVISAAGNLAKNNSSTLTLTGVNTYTGNTSVSGGTLEIGGAGYLGGGDYSGNVSIASGATFLFSSSASGTLARYRGDISGDGTFIKDGSNSELRFLGDVSVANVEVKQGTLRVQGTVNSLGQGGTTLRLGDTTGADDATIWYVTDIGTYATKAGIVVEAGSSGTKTIQNSGVNTENTAITLNDNLTINDLSTFGLGGVISGTGGLTKTGAGTTTLNAANTYTGAVNVNAGTLKIGNTTALGAHETADTKVTVASGATVDFNGVADAVYGYTISGTGVGGNGALVNNGAAIATNKRQASNITLAADASIGGTGDWALLTTAYNPTTLDLAANTLTKVGTNTFYLVNSTVTAGAIQIDEGTFSQTNANGKKPNGHDLGAVAVSMADTAGATLDLNNLNLAAGSLAGGGATGGNVSLGSGTLTVGALNGNTSYAGVISGTGGLTKTGSGTQTLSGANTYSGTTTISGGTLSLASGFSHTGGGAYTVEGGTLKIADGVSVGSAMTIGLGGVISPGNSPGTAATGSQTWNDGGAYLWEINASDIDGGGTKGNDPGWDWLDITGTLDLTNLTTGGFTIDIDSLTASNLAGDAVGFDTWTKGAPGDVDYSFTIATASGGITGFLAENFLLDSSGFSNAPQWDWQIVLSGNDLVLEAYAVPEPSSAALLGLGGLALALRRRRS